MGIVHALKHAWNHLFVPEHHGWNTVGTFRHNPKLLQIDKWRGDDSRSVYRKYITIMHFVSKVGGTATCTYHHNLATQKYPDTSLTCPL